MTHPATILTFHDEKVRIDRDIASLLQKMWRLGINTTNSCQAQCARTCNHKQIVHPIAKDGTQFFDKVIGKNCNSHIWIVFLEAIDMENFYNLVGEYKHYNLKDFRDYKNKDDMYYKMGADTVISSNKKKVSDRWEALFVMRNDGVEHKLYRPTINGKRLGYEKWVPTGNCRKNSFRIEPQLYFPRCHLEYVESRLDGAIKKFKK